MLGDGNVSVKDWLKCADQWFHFVEPEMAFTLARMLGFTFVTLINKKTHRIHTRVYMRNRKKNPSYF